MKRLLAAVFLLCASAFAGTCGNSYTYSLKFTVPASQVPNTDQTNFPVTLAFNGAHFFNSYYLPDLKTVANSGKIQNTANNSNTVSGPADLILCDAASAGNALKFEVSQYTATTGAMEAYVSIPTLSHTSATSFWMFYGNAAVVTTQQDLSFWATANFKSVYHMSDGTTLSAKDSTGTFNGTITTAIAATGASDGAMNPNTTGKIDTGNAQSTAGVVTMEAWLNPTTIPAACEALIYNDGGTGGMVFSMNPTCTSTGKLFTGIKNGGTYQFTNTNESISAGTWNHVASTMTGSGTGNSHMYINGTEATYSAPSGSGSLGTPTANLVIGDSWPGPVDEVRISSVVRSADWLKSTYNTESSPSEFALASTQTSATGARILQYTTCKSAQSVANACVFPNNIVSGNPIIVISSNAGNTGNCTAPNINSKFTDTRGSTFTFAMLSQNLSGGDVCIAFASAAGSGAETITSPSNAVASQSMVAYEVAGTTGAALDVVASATGGGTSSISTGSATATTSNSIQLCGFSGTLTGPQPVYSTSVSPTGFALNTVSPVISGPINEGGTSFLAFTGSGSKSCTFSFGTGPSNTAAAMAVLKYSPVSVASKRRQSQIY